MITEENASEQNMEKESEPAGSQNTPLSGKISWAMGAVADQFATNGMQGLTFPIYNLALGVDPRLLGVAQLIQRVFDAITDPFIGNLSDNTRSRWGRRRPYMFVGTILMAAAFIFLWMPPAGWSKTMLIVYYAILSCVCYLGYAIFAIPRQAMGIEISTDYHERTRVFALNSVFAYIALLMVPWLYWVSIRVGNVLGYQVKGELVGVKYVALVVGAIMIVTGVAGALFCKERLMGVLEQRKVGFSKAFAMTINNFPFILFFFIIFIILTSCFMIAPMNIYISIDYICGGDREYGSFVGGWNGMMQGVAGLCATPFIVMIAKKIGKKKTLFCGQCVGMIGFASSWWLFTPKYPYLQLIHTLLVHGGFACAWVLSGSIMADICDIDELKNGLRREAMFGAVYQFLMKLCTSVGSLIAGFILVWSGYRQGSLQSSETLTNMRLLFIVIPVIGVTISLILVVLFPITEQSARNVRQRLNEKYQLKN